MSTTQPTARLAPRIRVGLRTVLIAIGVLVAIAVAITILALTGANRTTVATPVTVSQAASGPPQTRYLGPRQQQAAAEAGAKLDHSGRGAAVAQTTGRLANYPDAPPPSSSTPRQSIGYYLDAPTVSDHPGHH